MASNTFKDFQFEHKMDGSNPGKNFEWKEGTPGYVKEVPEVPKKYDELIFQNHYLFLFQFYHLLEQHYSNINTNSYISFFLVEHHFWMISRLGRSIFL